MGGGFGTEPDWLCFVQLFHRGKIGGDAPLTQNGLNFSRKVSEFRA